MSNNENAGSGVMGMLLVLFIGLKLAGYIDWSWWWVMAPLWGPLVFAVLVGIIAGIFYLLRR